MGRSRLRCRFGTEPHDKHHSIRLISRNSGAYGPLSVFQTANLYSKADLETLGSLERTKRSAGRSKRTGRYSETTCKTGRGRRTPSHNHNHNANHPYTMLRLSTRTQTRPTHSRSPPAPQTRSHPPPRRRGLTAHPCPPSSDHHRPRPGRSATTRRGWRRGPHGDTTCRRPRPLARTCTTRPQGCPTGRRECACRSRATTSSL